MNIGTPMLSMGGKPREISHFFQCNLSLGKLWVKYRHGHVKPGNRTLYPSVLFLVFQENLLPEHFHYLALGFFQGISKKGLTSRGWVLSLTQSHLFLCCLWLKKKNFFLKAFIGTPTGARQYTVTNNCTFKLNKMQCSLIFLKTCGKAVGRKNMGFGGRLFQFHFSGFTSYVILFIFPKPSQPWSFSPWFLKIGIIIISLRLLSGTWKVLNNVNSLYSHPSPTPDITKLNWIVEI